MMGAAFRSLVVVVLLPLALAVIGVLVLQTQLQARLSHATETRLNAEVQGFEALYDQRRIVALRQAIEFRSLRGDPAGSVYLLIDRKGAALAGSLPRWPEAIPKTPSLAERDIAALPYLVKVQELRGGFGLLVGVSLEPQRDMLVQMRRVFVGFGALMVAAGLITALLVARQAQGRTARMNAALADVGAARGLTVRMPQDAPAGSDHAILAGHIDDMLARIAHLFEAHQRLGNAVAHEMRTPLARIRTRLDKLDLDAAARAGLDEEIRTTIRLFDSLLSIAQMDAEAGHTASLAPVDLSAIAATIIELYAPVAEEEGRRLEGDLVAEAVILGDAQLLSQMISNLVENAIKYTRPGDAIRVLVSREGSRVRLGVEDDGPGVEDSLKDRLFTPFARGADTSETPGHGLGLSLVRAIALRHGAQPRVVERQKGFAIEVTALHFSQGGDDGSNA